MDEYVKSSMELRTLTTRFTTCKLEQMAKMMEMFLLRLRLPLEEYLPETVSADIEPNDKEIKGKTMLTEWKITKKNRRTSTTIVMKEFSKQMIQDFEDHCNLYISETKETNMSFHKEAVPSEKMER